MEDGWEGKRSEKIITYGFQTFLLLRDWLALVSSPQDILCSSYRVTRLSLMAIEEYYCTFVGTSLHGPNNIAGENVTVILWNSYNKALSLRPKTQNVPAIARARHWYLCAHNQAREISIKLKNDSNMQMRSQRLTVVCADGFLWSSKISLVRIQKSLR